MLLILVSCGLALVPLLGKKITKNLYKSRTEKNDILVWLCWQVIFYVLTPLVAQVIAGGCKANDQVYISFWLPASTLGAAPNC